MRAVLIIMLVVLLIGCRQTSLNYVQYTGTEGFDITFTTGAPPQEVHEGMPFPVKVEVHNKGALEVPYNRMLLTFSADPLYVDRGLLQLKPKQVDMLEDTIQGRSLAYPEGERELFSIPAANAFAAKQVIGTLQEPKATISASVCYAYSTLLTASVCIDTSQGNERAQACKAVDLTFSGGQGAPIAVTGIEVEAFPVYDDFGGGESVKPFFIIHFQDVGQGRLIGPNTLPLETACLLTGIPPEELGAVEVQAWLFDEELECQPEFVKLYDGVGETRCTVPAEDLGDTVYKATQNFLTTLVINASYLYKDSAEAEFSIRRSPVPITGIPVSRKIEGYVYDGDLIRPGPNGHLTVCEDYRDHPERAPEGVREFLRPDSSCACNQRECLAMALKDGTCVHKGGVCPSPMFCCSGTPPEEPEEDTPLVEQP